MNVYCYRHIKSVTLILFQSSFFAFIYSSKELSSIRPRYLCLKQLSACLQGNSAKFSELVNTNHTFVAVYFFTYLATMNRNYYKY